MLVQIEYNDKKFDYVKNWQLDNLLEMHKIQRFRRVSGWVTVGVDPIRARRNVSKVDALERRNNY